MEKESYVSTGSFKEFEFQVRELKVTEEHRVHSLIVSNTEEGIGVFIHLKYPLDTDNEINRETALEEFANFIDIVHTGYQIENDPEYDDFENFVWKEELCVFWPFDDENIGGDKEKFIYFCKKYHDIFKSISDVNICTFIEAFDEAIENNVTCTGMISTDI